MRFITKQDWYSLGVFLMLLTGEFVAVWGGVYQHSDSWMWFEIGPIVILILLLIIGSYKDYFKFESPTFTSLLANAIAPRPVSVLYLLGFVMHLSWMTDGVLNYLVGDPWKIPLCVGGVGLLILWVAFPSTTISYNYNKNVVFISGISKICVNSIPIRYNENEELTNVISLYNLIPLIRILNLVFVSKEIGPERVAKFLILSTNGNTINELLKDYKNIEGKVEKLAIDVTEFINNNERLKHELNLLSGNNVIDVDNHEKQIIRLDFQTHNVNDILTTIIRIAALIEFPQQLDFIQKLNIDFTKHQCDYDSFDECFETLRNAVEKEDNKKQLLYFNLTPGTGIVGSLMTLLSIDNDRKLYFYAQHSNIPKEQRLKPLDKSKVPMENLLSQALQKLKNPI